MDSLKLVRVLWLKKKPILLCDVNDVVKWSEGEKPNWESEFIIVKTQLRIGKNQIVSLGYNL